MFISPVGSHETDPFKKLLYSKDKIMNIGFTGHRDCYVSPDALEIILKMWPKATWIHGGASSGFDAQIADYCEKHQISSIVIRPEYTKYYWKVAPIIRNKEIVNMSDIIYACYDGRQTGGTKATIEYANKKGKVVYYLLPIKGD